MGSKWSALMMLLAPLFLDSTSNAQSVAFKTIHEFSGGIDGEHPSDALVIGAKAVLYGTSIGGGAAGEGTVFSLTPPAAAGGAWTEEVLYSFGGALAGDGSQPYGGLVIGAGGVLYGATGSGGNENEGTV